MLSANMIGCTEFPSQVPLDFHLEHVLGLLLDLAVVERFFQHYYYFRLTPHAAMLCPRGADRHSTSCKLFDPSTPMLPLKQGQAENLQLYKKVRAILL